MDLFGDLHGPLSSTHLKGRTREVFTMDNARSDKRVDLVFEGGGVKGIALVGAYSVLEEQGYQPNNVAGTSAGSIVGALVAAGYSSKELHDVLAATNFHEFEGKGWEDKIFALRIPLTIMKDHGIYEGKRFYEWMRNLLESKGITKFGQLRNEEATDDRYRYRLQVIASNVTDRELLILPLHAERVGCKPDELEIADAVRMSMSIPVFFEPVTVSCPDGRDRVIVDGGMLSNFPVWLFDSPREPRWPTFGLKLVSPEPKTVVGAPLPEAPGRHGPVKELVRYLMGLMSTMTDAHDKLYLERDTFVRTISIPNLGVKATQFDLSTDLANQLFESGRAAAARFLQTWDFEGYKREFRTGKQHSRRAAVSSAIRAAGSA
jgi:NTE family protein